jgi:metallo-beta-lactamase class B
MSFRPWVALLVVSGCLLGCGGNQGVPAAMLGWNQPFPPFRVAGNVHYVGTNYMALFLITTPQGHILLDSGFEAKVPMLKQNIERLGFRFSDIKILLSSHAHIDHVQGHALVKRLTGARVLASRDDAAVISTGGKNEWMYGDSFAWAPCVVDGIVEDGATVALGGTTLTAHLTPGHSRGATTWTMQVSEPGVKGARGDQLDVVFFPSGGVPAGVRVVDNPAFPGAVDAYERSYATWRALPCDVFLGAHGEFFDLQPKWKRWQKAGLGGPNPFIDAAGYKVKIEQFHTKFRAVVQSQS